MDGTLRGHSVVATVGETAGGALAAAGCGVALNGKDLLRHTTLALAGGSVTGIIGHNGSGKTTLLKCLARQLTPTTGEVTLDGRPLAAWGSRPFARRVAYLPQQLPASTGLTGRELVAFGRYPWHGPLGRVGAQGAAAIAEAMRISGTDAFADRLVDTLSGGERQRLWIAMMLAQESDFILLDEPLAALDLAHQVEVMSLLRELARTRGAGVVLVVHDINMAARFCDRIVALKAGALVADGTPESIMRDDVLEEIFGLPMRILAGCDTASLVAVPA